MSPSHHPTHDAITRIDEDGFEWGLGLIEVPNVVQVRPRSSTIDAWERDWAQARGRRNAPRRRRLRREIRLVACVGLVFIPAFTALGTWGFPPVRNLAASEFLRSTAIEDVDSSSIRLSIKPYGSVDVEPESPVVFPGYLLPVERREDPSHEGS